VNSTVHLLSFMVFVTSIMSLVKLYQPMTFSLMQQNHSSHVILCQQFLPFKFMYMICYFCSFVCLALSAVVADAYSIVSNINSRCHDKGFMYTTGRRLCAEICPPNKTTDLSLYFCKKNCEGMFTMLYCWYFKLKNTWVKVLVYWH